MIELGIYVRPGGRRCPRLILKIGIRTEDDVLVTDEGRELRSRAAHRCRRTRDRSADAGIAGRPAIYST